MFIFSSALMGEFCYLCLRRPEALPPDSGRAPRPAPRKGLEPLDPQNYIFSAFYISYFHVDPKVKTSASQKVPKVIGWRKFCVINWGRVFAYDIQKIKPPMLAQF